MKKVSTKAYSLLHRTQDRDTKEDLIFIFKTKQPVTIK